MFLTAKGGWGKRSNDEPQIQEVAAFLEPNQDLADYDSPMEEKRKWKPFNEGWGKRTHKWDSFKGETQSNF